MPLQPREDLMRFFAAVITFPGLDGRTYLLCDQNGVPIRFFSGFAVDWFLENLDAFDLPFDYLSAGLREWFRTRGAVYRCEVGCDPMDNQPDGWKPCRLKPGKEVPAKHLAIWWGDSWPIQIWRACRTCRLFAEAFADELIFS